MNAIVFVKSNQFMKLYLLKKNHLLTNTKTVYDHFWEILEH